MRIFKGTTLIGKSIPAADITLTGLFTSSKTLIIGPRGIEDIAEQLREPAITISPEKIEQTAGKLGQTVEVATLHVSAKNMTQPTFFELAGKNADQFALSKTKIEKRIYRDRHRHHLHADRGGCTQSIRTRYLPKHRGL